MFDHLQPLPPAGYLSRMAITQAAGVLAAGVGLVGHPWHEVFQAWPDAELRLALWASIAAMGLHKLESYLTGEFHQCPVYQESGRAGWARDPRRAIFVVFCGMLVLFLTLIALVLEGPPWPMLLLGVWAAHGLHEIHHLGKSLARRRYYPATLSGLLFTGVMAGWFVPVWLAQLDGAGGQWVLWGYMALLPLVLGAFYWEDRQWLARAVRVGEGS